MIAGTGKVAGIVTSKETGDPLPGVNVFISEFGKTEETNLKNKNILTKRRIYD